MLSLEGDLDSSETTQRSMERIIRGLGIVPIQSTFIHLLGIRILSVCCVAGSQGQSGSHWTHVQRDGETLCTGEYGSCPGNLGGILAGPSTVPYLL